MYDIVYVPGTCMILALLEFFAVVFLLLYYGLVASRVKAQPVKNVVLFKERRSKCKQSTRSPVTHTHAGRGCGSLALNSETPSHGKPDGFGERFGLAIGWVRARLYMHARRGTAIWTVEGLVALTLCVMDFSMFHVLYSKCALIAQKHNNYGCGAAARCIFVRNDGASKPDRL